MAKDDVEPGISFDLEKEEFLKHLRMLESEKRYLENEIRRLQFELDQMKRELNRLRAPPLLLGNVEDVLSDKKVVVRSSTGPSFVVNVSENVPHDKLKSGVRVALNKTTLAVIGVLPESYDPSVVASEIITKPDVTYDDIGGLDSQLREVRETVELPLLHPELFKKVGIEPPKGILLIGPPGTGKTLVAKAVAHHTNATFIRTVGSELVRKYIGEGARLVRELFDLAREKSPSILFIDEIDAIGARRMDLSTSGDREVQRTLMQLLAEIDGFDPLGNVKIIAATNRPDILDEALIRPGRFDRIIEIPLPDENAREKIFRIHTRKMNIRDVEISALAKETNGLSGADIKAICTEAGMNAIREMRDYVTMIDFIKAIEKVKKSAGGEETAPGHMFG
ncbi:MAG: proteasome-activating nucleotidase [Thermoplasmata archaeon]|jgi:proteasome regulatory subunit|nr:proteasome-activating nucleotidase [Thermoplasmata archaeon]MVT12896.1 proteasome-activating nucleotidase [Euryarchaeota archaeon]MVT15155.1 proteasome-activating nucleotidase [Euryarchaeota archaeon]MVT36444.1 proteasome-activating nucleotidase [Euryarchaeota archaeon]